MGNKAQYITAFYFPTIAKACEDLPTGTLVDGEIIAMDSEGQISFNPNAVDSTVGQGPPQRSQWLMPRSTLWAMVCGRLARQLTEGFELWMKYDFATVQLGGITAPAYPLPAMLSSFNYGLWVYMLQIIVLRRPLSASTFRSYDLSWLKHAPRAVVETP